MNRRKYHIYTLQPCCTCYFLEVDTYSVFMIFDIVAEMSETIAERVVLLGWILILFI